MQAMFPIDYRDGKGLQMRTALVPFDSDIASGLRYDGAIKIIGFLLLSWIESLFQI